MEITNELKQDLSTLESACGNFLEKYESVLTSALNKQEMSAEESLKIDLMLELSDGRHALTLCHYPLLTWKHAKKSYMVHGHIHNDTGADFWPLLAARDNVLNAGVDINGYQPVTFDELLENNRVFKSGG